MISSEIQSVSQFLKENDKAQIKDPINIRVMER